MEPGSNVTVMPSWTVAEVDGPDGFHIARSTVVLAPDRMTLYLGFINPDDGQPTNVEKALTSITPEPQRRWMAVDTDGGVWHVKPAGCGACGQIP